ncbi:hypothetical protein ACK3ZE_12765, partial [Aeromonas caviae]
MTFHCEDGDIDASLNTHRWVDTGWSDPFSPPSPLRRFFFGSLLAHRVTAGQKNGSSRDLGEVEVDRQGAGKLAVSKHT